MRKFLISLLACMLILISCSKDDSRPWNEKITSDNLTTQSNFDWKTTKNYKITLSGITNHIVKITPATNNAVVYQKVFLSAGTTCITDITLPAYETSIRLSCNNKDTVLLLSNVPLTWVSK